MNLDSACAEVIAAGKKLVETGLIARTWGNVSCRIDDDRFAITPSGMAYDALRPKDIVVVKIADLHYEGHIKPSSEKGIHAQVYMQKPGIGFVIHTHQTNASVACVLGKNIDITGSNAGIIGESVVLADYGLPGTAHLRRNATEALKHSQSKAILMANHGALCFGEDRAQAFDVATALENECRRFIASTDMRQPTHTLGYSKRIGNEIVFNGEACAVNIKTGELGGNVPQEARLHTAIYRARKDINVIKASAVPSAIAASQRFRTIKPLLDDFAQIVGTDLLSVRWGQNDNSVVKALKRRNAVLIDDVGALCCAGDEGDADAVEMVVDKGCMAFLSAAAKGTLSPISPIECLLMRFVYKQKYAKQMNK